MNPIGAVQHWAIIALAAIILGGGFGAWERHQGKKECEAAGNAKVAALIAQYATATAKVEADARTKERANADAMATINAQHTQELQDAQAKSDAVAADLRDGSLRLRREWAGCEAAAGVSQTLASTAQLDAAAASRAKSAATVVRIGASADAQIRALQAIVKADRQ